MKVGEYVRTNDRGIRKIGKIIDDLFYRDEEDNLHQKGNLIKSSPNIIDLIEVGDYVNGMEVTSIEEDIEGKYVFGYSCEGFEGETMFYNKDIKSIVTKEQFESIEYKVGEKE